MYILSTLKKVLQPQIYNGIIDLIFNYCCTVFIGLPSYLSDKIDIIHKRALKVFLIDLPWNVLGSDTLLKLFFLMLVHKALFVLFNRLKYPTLLAFIDTHEVKLANSLHCLSNFEAC